VPKDREMSQPAVARAHLPAAYGLRKRSTQLTWNAVDERLAGARHYWIATVGADGAPAVRPIDGVWLDGVLYFGGDPAARWRRNLGVNARTSVHLEDAERAVIVEGEVGAARPDRELAVRLADASNAKYGMAQSAGDYEGQEVLALRPRVVLAWNVLYKDATRFTFD
jgi:hypothetical protein